MISGDNFRWAHPSTWPWFFDVWIAITIVASCFKPFWKWLRQKHISAWPSTLGRIESAAIDPKKRFVISSSPRTASEKYVAEIDYSYTVAGNTYTGTYTRDFFTDSEALEFIRDLRGKPISVNYRTEKPSTSHVLDSAFDTLLQTRGPAEPRTLILSIPGSIPSWTKNYIWLFMGLSAIGLIASLWVHLGAVMGRRVAPEAFFWILHMGIFVVWIPAVLVAKQRVGSLQRKDFWKQVLKDSPEWMRYMVYFFLAYAFVNFMLFMLKAPAGNTDPSLPSVVWRGFSGHWMAFYSAALAILYSATRGDEPVLRCTKGHAVSEDCNFCPRCGRPVVHSR